MRLRGLSLVKLVPEQDAQTVSPCDFAYIAFFLSLAFNYIFLAPVGSTWRLQGEVGMVGRWRTALGPI